MKILLSTKLSLCTCRCQAHDLKMTMDVYPGSDAEYGDINRLPPNLMLTEDELMRFLKMTNKTMLMISERLKRLEKARPRIQHTNEALGRLAPPR
jgi:hypothetical protein